MAFTSEQLVESAMVLMVFFLAYRIFLMRQASFNMNRAYLLAGVLLSLILPFINFTLPKTLETGFLIELKVIDVIAEGKKVVEGRSFFAISHWLQFFYWAGIIFFTIKFLYQFILLSNLFHNSRIVRKPQVRIVYTRKDHPVFSFLNYVFVGSKSEHCNELDIIIDHERVHVVQKHSIDLLLLELLAIVQWFNPIVWLYREMVKQNHEYLADRAVLKAGIPDEKYQTLLLGNYRSLALGFTNSFNHSLTLKRLVMMRKSNSNKLSAFKLILIVPIILIAIYFISCSKNEQVTEDQINSDKIETKDNSNTAKSELIEGTHSGKDSVYQIATLDVKPEFPGGDVALIKFIAENVVYPVAAKEKGIEGTVYVGFEINKNGKIENAEIMQSANPMLENEALRVVRSLPQWKPGVAKGQPVAVKFTIPIKFKLQ